VEDSLGGPAVVQGVVEDALVNPITGQNPRLELVFPGGERELSGEAVAIKDQSIGGNSGDLTQPCIGQIGVEEALNPLVGGWKVVFEKTVFLTEVPNEIPGEFQGLVLGFWCLTGRLTQGGQLHIENADQLATNLGILVVVFQTEIALGLHLELLIDGINSPRMYRKIDQWSKDGVAFP